MRTLVTLSVLVLVVVVAVVFGQDRSARAPGAVAGAAGPALDDIRAEHIAAHLKFLSSDLLEGRAPSTRGGQLAAEYLATQLAQLGYAPGGDNGTYFQNVPV